MAEWMALTGALAATVLGFAWLALAMEDHWQQVYGGSTPSQATQHALRMLGASGIIVSGILCFIADRPSMAVLVWILFMAFGAASIALTLSWKPALLRIAFPMRKS
jgi:hypothetical protein